MPGTLEIRRIKLVQADKIFNAFENNFPEILFLFFFFVEKTAIYSCQYFYDCCFMGSLNLDLLNLCFTSE